MYPGVTYKYYVWLALKYEDHKMPTYFSQELFDVTNWNKIVNVVTAEKNLNDT